MIDPGTEVVIRANAPDIVLPSGAPIGRLNGRPGVVVGPSQTYNDSYLVEVDGEVYDVHWDHLDEGASSEGEFGQVVIEGAVSDLQRFRTLGDGLAVTVEPQGHDLTVQGEDLDAYLARLEPDVWDPACARGDA